jgi:predicted transport protein
MQYIKPERISLRNHPNFSEKWVQARIAEDPTLLGLGDLVLRDQERPQPYSGRLDLLLQDPETNDRFEVELQLGATDESHIIRTIEYWDIERKRYPQYDHTAVIVAEEITGRFLNVISLFNGTIPLIAIQLQAVKFGDHISLVATKVLDRMDRGLEGEDEEVREVTDRAYWEQRATRDSVSVADGLLKKVQQLDHRLELKYNKFYIGLAKEDQAFNFVWVVPKKKFTSIKVRLDHSPEWDEKLEQTGITVDYEKRSNNYRLRLSSEQFQANSELLDELIKAAFAQRQS